MRRIDDKIEEIERFLKDLKELKLTEFSQYKKNKIQRAACERYVEKIVEAATDLAFIIIKLRKFQTPDDDSDAFAILEEKGILTSSLKENLRHSKGMRKVIAHQYFTIDDEVVFEAAKNKLPRDINRFIRSVKK